MKQVFSIWFALAFGIIGCAAPSEVTPSPTLPAPLITIMETDNATAVPSPPTEDTAECGAILTATASSTNLIIGETMTVTVTHDNRQGCYAIGIPQYSLRFVSTEQGTAVDAPAFEPNDPKATLTEGPSSVAIGQMKTVVFEVEALRSGEFFVNTHVSYEYQAAGAEQPPWVWGADGARPLLVQVVAFDMAKLPECIPPADLESLGYDWRDCTLTEIEGSDGWAAVQWGRHECNHAGQLVLANLNTGELRRFTDRPLRDFLGETVEETAVWGDRLLLYQQPITREKWLLGGAEGCHGGIFFFYDVADDTLRLAPLGNNPDWNETRTAGIHAVAGYIGPIDTYEARISGYHVLTDQSFRVSGDRYMWTPDQSHALLQTMAFEQTTGPLPADSTHYQPDQESADTSLIIFSPPRSIQLANLATGEVTLLAGEDGYSYWLCEWEEACAWQGDWLPIRRIVEQPPHTLALTDFNHPHYRCYTTADDCPVPVEYFLLNWRTGERTPYTILSPTPTPPPVLEGG